MPVAKQHFWTNPSVIKFAGANDPINAILSCAQRVVFEAMEEGWTGPPFDPFKLAQLRHICVVPKDNVEEARLSVQSGRPTVEYNPLKPQSRIRYSVAHEVAHSLFPDFRETTRNRAAHHADAESWQLEMLCNLAAAEFLMPTGTLIGPLPHELDIHAVIEWRKRYQVSTEAMLLRLLRTQHHALMVFSASTTNGEDYIWDYVLTPAGPITNLYGSAVDRNLPVRNCVAIGYTDKGNGELPGIGRVRLECVGIPGYPASTHPRIVGFARPIDSTSAETSELKEIRGNALKPRGNLPYLLAHVVNDKARSWGAGFGKQVALNYPKLAERFRVAMESSNRPRLGDIFAAQVDDNLTVVQMVAQSGYGESDRPRVRYASLQDCLRKLRDLASQKKASVHMPPIGTGYGGGAWSLIRELIEQELVARGVNVTVYQLHEQPAARAKQPSLFRRVT